MSNSVLVYIEKGEDGSYWASSQNLPGVVAAQGISIPDLKTQFKKAYQDYLEVAKELEEDWLLDWKECNEVEYKIDLQAFFKLVPEIKIGGIAKKAGINESLLRQYATGKAKASEDRLKEIESAVHELGKELQEVSF